jgi:hypothetical protein
VVARKAVDTGLRQYGGVERHIVSPWIPWHFLLYVGGWFLLAFACGYAFYRLQLLEKPTLNALFDRRGVLLALAVAWVLMLAPGFLLLASGPTTPKETKRGAGAHAGFPFPWDAQGPLPHLDRHWVRDTEGALYRSVGDSAAIIPWALAIDAAAMSLGAVTTVSLSRRAAARARRRRGEPSVLDHARRLLRRHRLYVPSLRMTVALAATGALIYALRLLASLGAAPGPGWA